MLHGNKRAICGKNQNPVNTRCSYSTEFVALSQSIHIIISRINSFNRTEIHFIHNFCQMQEFVSPFQFSFPLSRSFLSHPFQCFHLSTVTGFVTIFHSLHWSTVESSPGLHFGYRTTFTIFSWNFRLGIFATLPQDLPTRDTKRDIVQWRETYAPNTIVHYDHSTE